MRERTYFGFDLGQFYSQLSYYRDSMEEPVTISSRVGTEEYLIRTLVGKRPGHSQWFIGQDAENMDISVDNLLSRASKREMVRIEDNDIAALDLLTLFVRRVFSMLGPMDINKEEDMFVFTVLHASSSIIDAMLEVCDRLEIKRECVRICSRQEALCYYCLKQDKSLHLNEVMLMDYWKDSFRIYELKKDYSVTPVVVTVSELKLPDLKDLNETRGLTKEEIMEHKDRVLYDNLDSILKGKMISSIYLVGDGFTGEWMKKSLARLCAGRRVFYGMNLYTKGACYYGYTSENRLIKDPGFVYLGGGNMVHNVCLKVLDKNETRYHVLVPAGLNFQDAKGSCDLMPSGQGPFDITIYVRSVKGNNEASYELALDGLISDEKHPNRIRITGEAISKDRVRIFVKELGFGDIYPGRNQKWEKEIKLTF